jgi:hypothetical protein
MKLKIGFKNPQHFDCSYDQVSVAYVEIPSIPPWCSRRLVPMVMDPGFFFLALASATRHLVMSQVRFT